MDYPGRPDEKQQPPPPAYDQQPSAPTYNQQPSAPTYNQQPSAPTYNQQPSTPTYNQQPPAYEQQPSAPTDDLKPLADSKRPPTDDQLPPAYSQLTAKRKFVSPPLNPSRFPTPYSQQPYIPLEEYPEQSVKPVDSEPAGDGIFSVFLAGEKSNSGQQNTTNARWSSPYSQQPYIPLEEYPEQSVKPVASQPAGDGIISVFLAGEKKSNSGQRNTATEMYPEEECFRECMGCGTVVGYTLQFMCLFCGILSACK